MDDFYRTNGQIFMKLDCLTNQTLLFCKEDLKIHFMAKTQKTKLHL